MEKQIVKKTTTRRVAPVADNEEMGIDTMNTRETDEFRASRELETWDAENIREEDLEKFQPEGMLDTKEIRPRPGMVQRWIRTVDFSGNPDNKNVMKAYNLGWRPRLSSTVERGVFVATIDFRGLDVIGVEGNILMERPEMLHEKAKQAVINKTRLQQASVKTTLQREAAPQPGSGFHAPHIEDKSSVSVAKPAPVADD